MMLFFFFFFSFNHRATQFTVLHEEEIAIITPGVRPAALLPVRWCIPRGAAGRRVAGAPMKGKQNPPRGQTELITVHLSQWYAPYVTRASVWELNTWKGGAQYFCGFFFLPANIVDFPS